MSIDNSHGESVTPNKSNVVKNHARAMGVPWYEGKFYIVALRDHVNLGFSVKILSERKMALFEGKGKMMRHVKFYSLEDVDEARVAKLLRLVAEKGTGC